jgi:hypothetical protein
MRAVSSARSAIFAPRAVTESPMLPAAKPAAAISVTVTALARTAQALTLAKR